MSELDKMLAFGAWLSSRKVQLQGELYALSVSARQPEASIRVKAGHLEAVTHVLDAFTILYRGDLNKFREQYLGEQLNDEEEELEDGHSTGTA